MLYMIVGSIEPDSAERRSLARPQHLQRLQELSNEGRLILAGPCPAVDSPDPGPAGYTASLIVAEFPSLSHATSWAEDDPYMHSGVYRHVAVKPFLQVLP